MPHLRQLGGAGEEAVDALGGFAAFGDGPDHQRLAAAHIAGGEHAGDARHVIAVGGHVAARVERYAELFDHAVFHGAEETHGEQHQVGLNGEFAPADRFELGRRPDAQGVQLVHLAAIVAGETGGGDSPIARAAFFVRGFDAQLHGPERPRGGRRAIVGRFGQQLELGDTGRALAMTRPQAIGAGVAAADDDHALAGGQDGLGFRHRVAFVAAVLLRQKLHGEVNAPQVAAGHVEVARMFGAAGEQDGIELLAQILHWDIAAHLGAGLELDAFAAHLLQAPVDEVLFHFEIGDAVAQQAADAVALFKHGDGVAGARQLLRGGQAGRARANHGHALAGLDGGRLRPDEALFKAAIDDRAFDLLDGDRRLIDAEHAGSLAGSRADAAGEFGEIVGGVQLPHGVVPAAMVDEVVPIGNQVGERATGVAERNPAIHAASGLAAQVRLGERAIDFKPVLDALGRRAAFGHFARILHEPGGFSHVDSVIKSTGGKDRWRYWLGPAGYATAVVSRWMPRTRLYSCGKTLTNLGTLPCGPP